MFSYGNCFLFFPNIFFLCTSRQHKMRASFSGELLRWEHYFLHFMINCRVHIKRQILHFKTLTHIVLNNWSLCDLEFRNELSVKIDSLSTSFGGALDWLFFILDSCLLGLFSKRAKEISIITESNSIFLLLKLLFVNYVTNMFAFCIYQKILGTIFIPIL